MNEYKEPIQPLNVEKNNEDLAENFSNEVVSFETSIEDKKMIAEDEKLIKQKDEARINQIMEVLGVEKRNENEELQKELQNYYSLEKESVEKIGIIKAKDLPEKYRGQFEALGDERLGGVNIAIVPDDIWKKGQPTESSAEKNLILVRQSYFETQEKPDEIAWMAHELAHCQSFMDSQSKEQYQKDMQTFAFEDLKTEYPYPNNLVEKQTFTKQFDFLKNQGKNREEIVSMLGSYYGQEDTPFFNRLLDDVYGV